MRELKRFLRPVQWIFWLTILVAILDSGRSDNRDTNSNGDNKPSKKLYFHRCGTPTPIGVGAIETPLEYSNINNNNDDDDDSDDGDSDENNNVSEDNNDDNDDSNKKPVWNQNTNQNINDNQNHIVIESNQYIGSPLSPPPAPPSSELPFTPILLKLQSQCGPLSQNDNNSNDKSKSDDSIVSGSIVATTSPSSAQLYQCTITLSPNSENNSGITVEDWNDIIILDTVPNNYLLQDIMRFSAPDIVVVDQHEDSNTFEITLTGDMMHTLDNHFEIQYIVDGDDFMPDQYCATSTATVYRRKQIPEGNTITSRGCFQVSPPVFEPCSATLLLDAPDTVLFDTVFTINTTVQYDNPVHDGKTSFQLSNVLVWHKLLQLRVQNYLLHNIDCRVSQQQYDREAADDELETVFNLTLSDCYIPNLDTIDEKNTTGKELNRYLAWIQFNISTVYEPSYPVSQETLHTTIQLLSNDYCPYANPLDVSKDVTIIHRADKEQ
jgi:hypothetical protein